MFEIKNISKKFGNEFALRNVGMDIGKGLNFIIGSSGSGKTTWYYVKKKYKLNMNFFQISICY